MSTHASAARWWPTCYVCSLRAGRRLPVASMEKREEFAGVVFRIVCHGDSVDLPWRDGSVLRWENHEEAPPFDVAFSPSSDRTRRGELAKHVENFDRQMRHQLEQRDLEHARQLARVYWIAWAFCIALFAIGALTGFLAARHHP